MRYCPACGSTVEDQYSHCPTCGCVITSTDFGHNYLQNGIDDMTGGARRQAIYCDAADIQKNKIWAVLSYVGFLVILPLLFARKSTYARFHINQGLSLAICKLLLDGALWGLHLLYWFFGGFLLFGGAIRLLELLDMIFLAFAIWGIVNSVQGKTIRLPLIGKIQWLR